MGFSLFKKKEDKDSSKSASQQNAPNPAVSEQVPPNDSVSSLPPLSQNKESQPNTQPAPQAPVNSQEQPTDIPGVPNTQFSSDPKVPSFDASQSSVTGDLDVEPPVPDELPDLPSFDFSQLDSEQKPQPAEQPELQPVEQPEPEKPPELEPEPQPQAPSLDSFQAPEPAPQAEAPTEPFSAPSFDPKKPVFLQTEQFEVVATNLQEIKSDVSHMQQVNNHIQGVHSSLDNQMELMKQMITVMIQKTEGIERKLFKNIG
ncbi:MAG: hypothetical protein ACMXYF_02985 [Candidatus Woesearchaeota archaeon]